MLAYSISILFTLIYSTSLFFTKGVEIPAIFVIYPINYGILVWGRLYFLQSWEADNTLWLQEYLVFCLPILSTAILLLKHKGLMGPGALGLILVTIVTLFAHMGCLFGERIYSALAQALEASTLKATLMYVMLSVLGMLPPIGFAYLFLNVFPSPVVS